MISLKTKNQGFTIIELLIVIIVIGILATLVITTFSGIQRNARNRTREADINAIHSQVEYYYGQNSVYPSLDQINESGAYEDSNWRADNLRGLDSEALTDPQGTSATLSGTTVTTPGSYSYVVSPDGCDNDDVACESYVLTAVYEGGGTFSKNSLN